MMMRLRIFWACALAALMLVAASAPATGALPSLDPERGVLTLAPLLERVTPGVVNIATRSRVEMPANPLFDDPFFRRFFRFPDLPRQREVMSAGSGVIVDARRGYVLTNHHVIEHADEVQVTLRDRRTFQAEVIGSDPDTDIALLKIEADGLSAVPLGDSDELKVGDVVLAIGNPFGIGQTVTSGIVSALGRRGLGIEGFEDFIQTDASINPGNSGGALVNSKGELVGINTAIIAPARGNVGIGFAVPINMARSVMDQLIAFGEVRRGRLGILIQDLTPDLAQTFGLDVRGGAVVTQVTPDSPAERAGLEPGDVIVEVNGQTIRDAGDLRNLVGLGKVGDRLDIALYRKGRLRHLQATIGEVQEARVSGEEAFPKLAGAVFQDIGPDAPMYGQLEGVLVAEVEAGSPAWRHGLRQGDVITGVNQQPVASVAELRRALEESGRAVVLHLVRGNARMIIVIQ